MKGLDCVISMSLDFCASSGSYIKCYMDLKEGEKIVLSKLSSILNFGKTLRGQRCLRRILHVGWVRKGEREFILNRDEEGYGRFVWTIIRAPDEVREFTSKGNKCMTKTVKLYRTLNAKPRRFQLSLSILSHCWSSTSQKETGWMCRLKIESRMKWSRCC